MPRAKKEEGLKTRGRPPKPIPEQIDASPEEIATLPYGPYSEALAISGTLVSR